MKTNSKILRGLFAAAITGGFLMSAASAFAEDVIITGTVAPVNTLAVTTPAGLTDAELTGGVADKTITTVTETSNSTGGYTVTLASLNPDTAGTTPQLVGVTASNIIPYTVTYGGTPVVFASGSSTVTNVTTSTTGVDKVLAISIVDGSPNADTYSDTLTLTIAAQ